MYKNEDIEFFSSETYLKSIPFKIYKLEGAIPFIKDHTHDYIQMWYVRKGGFIHSINNCKEYKMVKGDIYVLPPFLVHRVIPEPEEDSIIIGCEFMPHFINDKLENFNTNKDFFDFAYLEPFLVSEDMVRPKLNITGVLQTQVEDILEDMLTEYEGKNRYYEILLKGDLLRLLALVIRAYKSSGYSHETKEIFEKYRDAIKNTLQYIQQNFNEEIYLDDVCKYSMMSKTYFCYIFKSITGKTFSEYLIDLRIKRSIDLLLKTDMSVTDICYEVGFNDATNFCRMFKKIVGVPPKHYKNIVLEKGQSNLTYDD